MKEEMKVRYALCTMLLSGVALMATAQKSASSYRERLKNKEIYNKVMVAYSDSLANMVSRYESDSTWMERLVNVNPDYYRLFVPVTMYGDVISNSINKSGQEKLTPKDYLIPLANGSMEEDEEVNTSIDRTLLNVYLNNPSAVCYMEQEVMNQRSFRKDAVKNLRRSEQVADLIDTRLQEDQALNSELKLKRPNFWTKSGKAYLQFTQNYISGNWYKGGESNNTMLSGLTIEANYNDKQKVQWDNKLEWKLGFLSSRSDTLHKYKTNNDLLRLTSKLGLQAVKNWYYTLQAEFYTQLFPSYKSNNPDVVSSFLSPAYLKFDIGMDYKRSTKKYTVSAVLAPLSYKMTYVAKDEVNETSFSVDEGKKFKHDLGSNVQVTSTWKIITQVEWESRISYFTTYQKSQAEWENTFNFNLNRYLSTKLFVHARFDDGVAKKEGYNYFQLKELLSFGLSYNW